MRHNFVLVWTRFKRIALDVDQVFTLVIALAFFYCVLLVYHILLVFLTITFTIFFLQDMNWNHVDFPKSFFSGSLEGFWWSFVTMTTVG